jgi:hypothetical protein
LTFDNYSLSHCRNRLDCTSLDETSPGKNLSNFGSSGRDFFFDLNELTFSG